MNVLRNAGGGLRKSTALLAVAGSLGLAHSDAPNHLPPKAAAPGAEVQKDKFLNQVAVKIGKVILCMQQQTPNVTAYDSSRGPAVMVGFESTGRPSYELSAVVESGTGKSLDAGKTIAIDIHSNGKADTNLKIISGDPAVSEGLWIATLRAVDPEGDLQQQFDPMDVGPLPPLGRPDRQVQLARLAWHETEAAAHAPRMLLPGQNPSC